MRSWKSQSSTCRCTPGSELRAPEGEKSLSRRLRESETLEHEKAVGQHDESQVPMQTVPTSSLIVVETAFLFGIFVKLLDHPAGVGQRDQPLQGGLRGEGAE